MANTNSCSEGIPAHACYVRPINPAQRKAIQIYAMVLELAAIGGEDYTDTMASALIADSCAWKNLPMGDEREGATAAVMLANAENSGATVPAGINDVMEEVKCLQHVDLNTLDAIARNLQCRLGYHSAF